MSLAHEHAVMSDSRRTALRRNYETTLLEREAMKRAYEKNGCNSAGNINLQQYDWKLDRLRLELEEAGENVAPIVAAVVAAPAVEPVAEPVAAGIAAEIPKPGAIRNAVSSAVNRFRGER